MSSSFPDFGDIFECRPNILRLFQLTDNKIKQLKGLLCMCCAVVSCGTAVVGVVE